MAEMFERSPSNVTLTETAGVRPEDDDNDAERGGDGANSPKMWKSRIEKSKRVRKELLWEWSYNVDYRRGKPFAENTDYDRVNVNLDWSLTKGKHAQLFSQTPQLYLTPKQDRFAPAVPVFTKQLNDRLTQANVGAAIDEAVLDTINATGFGVALVAYESKTQDKKVPTDGLAIEGMPPDAVNAGLEDGSIPSTNVPEVVDARFTVQRLSPSDFLWPTEFTGSDFDQAPWLGRTGTMLWAEAKTAFALTDRDKDSVCGGRPPLSNLRQDVSQQTTPDDEVVEYDELFYWAYRYDPTCLHYKKIRRIVFVHGKTEPVVDEDWKGQQFDEQNNTYLGACVFPIRVLTLTYISDDAIPPSDSAIGRPQILEIIQSRSQVVLQRNRSLPIRWFDVNRIDTQIQDTLMRGEWQAMIPTQGDGSRSIGEVSRSSYPPENFEFDRIIKNDLQEQWQVGANQLGTYSSGERSASEAKIVQQNFQSRIGYERARVAGFFVGIGEVMAGLIALYDNFPLEGPEDLARLKTWDRRTINQEFVFYIRPDSTILLDANQRIDQLMRFLNLVGKSGYVNPYPIVEELAALHGLDPAKVMSKPQDKSDPPGVNYAFKGEDLSNPMVIAILMKSGQAPSPEDMQAALNLISFQTKAQLTAGMTSQVPGGAGPMPAIGPGSAPVPEAQPGIPEAAGPMSRITKRTEELGG